MHAEYFSCPIDEIKAIISAVTADRPLVAVGTTSVRLLESLYWLGVKELLSQSPSLSPGDDDDDGDDGDDVRVSGSGSGLGLELELELELGQWEPLHIQKMWEQEHSHQSNQSDQSDQSNPPHPVKVPLPLPLPTVEESLMAICALAEAKAKAKAKAKDGSLSLSLSLDLAGGAAAATGKGEFGSGGGGEGKEAGKEEGEVFISGKTSLCITPGYTFPVLCYAKNKGKDKCKGVKESGEDSIVGSGRLAGKGGGGGLVTNFHQADSTLMLLVCAYLQRIGHFTEEEAVEALQVCD